MPEEVVGHLVVPLADLAEVLGVCLVEVLRSLEVRGRRKAVVQLGLLW